MPNRALLLSILNELNSKDVKSPFESLSSLVKVLEEKNDPDPEEIEIVSVAYQFFEKLSLLESSLRNYSNKSKPPGTKLQSLYDQQRTIFD